MARAFCVVNPYSRHPAGNTVAASVCCACKGKWPANCVLERRLASVATVCSVDRSARSVG